MKKYRITLAAKSLDLTIEELAIISSALNEICHGIDVPEFETRIGSTIEEAKKLIEKINNAIDSSGY